MCDLADTGEKPYGCNYCEKSYARSDVLRRHIITNHKDKEDDFSQMGPLRKNKATSVAAPSAYPYSGSPEVPINVRERTRQQDPGVELLHSFQQQQPSPIASTSQIPQPASPPETTWYSTQATQSPNISAPLQQIPLLQQSQTLPYQQMVNSPSAMTPQVSQMLPMNNFPHAMQTNGYQHPNPASFPTQQKTPKPTSSVNGFPPPNHMMNYSTQGHGSVSGSSATTYTHTTDSNRSSVASSVAEMPPLGQSNAMWESTSLDPSLQEMIHQSQAPPSFGTGSTPEMDQQFWSSSLFDFSGLFPNESWNINPEFTRDTSASATDATPSEKLSEVWPTRPSRRKLGCCTPGYINCELPGADLSVGSNRKM